MSAGTELNQERLDLLTQYREGDKAALTKLCKSCEPLVGWIVNKFFSPDNTRGDLMGEAWVGFLEGIQKFDATRGNDLMVFLSIRVRARLARVVSRGFGSLQAQKVFWHLSHAEADLLEAGVEPTDEAVAEKLGVKKHFVEQARASFVPVDYDLIDAHNARPDEQYAEAEKLERLSSAIAGLSPREQAVVRARYYEDDTATAVGEALGISRTHATRIEKRALQNLKEALCD